MEYLLIRPELSKQLFESEEDAHAFISKVPEYERLDYSLEPNFEGKIRIICHKAFRVSQEDLAKFPEPYTCRCLQS